MMEERVQTTETDMHKLSNQESCWKVVYAVIGQCALLSEMESGTRNAVHRRIIPHISDDASP